MLRKLYRQLAYIKNAAQLVSDPNRLDLAVSLLKTHELFESNTAQTFWGSITAVDQEFVGALVNEAEQNSGPIVEIGCLFGFTTQLIASRKSPGRELITVDNFGWNPFHMRSDTHREFTKRALRFCVDHSQTSIFDGSSEAFFRDYRGPTPSLVFIDADHSYEGVAADIARSRQAGIPLISGHDYTEAHPGVKRAVDEAFGGHIEVRGTVWVARKPPVSGKMSPSTDQNASAIPKN